MNKKRVIKLITELKKLRFDKRFRTANFDIQSIYPQKMKWYNIVPDKQAKNESKKSKVIKLVTYLRMLRFKNHISFKSNIRILKHQNKQITSYKLSIDTINYE